MTKKPRVLILTITVRT